MRFVFYVHYVYYAEIQDGPPKERENDYWGNLPVDSGDTLQVKNFVEIALSRTVSEMNAFLHFTQKFKMAAKNGRKMILEKGTSRLCRHPVGQKFCQNRFISHRFRDIKDF